MKQKKTPGLLILYIKAVYAAIEMCYDNTWKQKYIFISHFMMHDGKKCSNET